MNVDQTPLACLAAGLLALVCFQYQFFNELPLVGPNPARYTAHVLLMSSLVFGDPLDVCMKGFHTHMYTPIGQQYEFLLVQYSKAVTPTISPENSKHKTCEDNE